MKSQESSPWEVPALDGRAFPTPNSTCADPQHTKLAGSRQWLPFHTIREVPLFSTTLLYQDLYRMTTAEVMVTGQASRAGLWPLVSQHLAFGHRHGWLCHPEPPFFYQSSTLLISRGLSTSYPPKRAVLKAHLRYILYLNICHSHKLRPFQTQKLEIVFHPKIFILVNLRGCPTPEDPV